MSKNATVALIVVAFIALAAGGIGLASGRSSDNPANELKITADTFPVPDGATVAFPDTTTDELVTKGWRAKGDLESACTAWREAFRGWIDQSQAAGVGQVTGEDQSGMRCSLTATKAGHKAELALSLYGDDPTPQATLVLRK